ncbi:MAG: hypothetical protein JST62_07945 [Bacteroidetes bacterium]|nr:hypothetical protein [Bacteroidota bacterium]
MKKLSRKEMKKVKGGDAPVEGGDCTGPCNLPQALCNSLKGCSTGSGQYNWKCCTPS